MHESDHDPSKQESETLFNPGKAQWLQEKGSKALDNDQQALLLAMAQLEAKLGRDLTAEEATALESLSAHMDGFDPQQIADAVQQMINAPADPKRKTAWPELKRHK
ncbi:MAG TPA: hypothetical protein PKH77_14490 [Anaerolineae bacterium]|nr:hypothetical protein [Anaerolineae bacterium]